MGTGNAAMALMKTHIVAEQALQMLIEDYKAGRTPPRTVNSRDDAASRGSRTRAGSGRSPI
jgi:hypothetical protein